MIDNELKLIIEELDDWLDSNVSPAYKDQPLAQNWARIGKLNEEVGEAIDALIGMTGQNPRKGYYGSSELMLDELADVALTAMYAIQHFTKNAYVTASVVTHRARYHLARIEE